MQSGVAITDQLTLERTGFMKMLAEEQIKSGDMSEGIRTAEDAYLLQKMFFKNKMNH